MVNMKNRILDHFGLKVLSLIIAIVIWVIVANVDDYTTTKQISGIEIEFINGDAITEKNKVYEVPEGTAIDIIVKGRRSIVEKLTNEDFKAVADLSKMSITNAVAVNVSAVSSRVDKELTISYTNNAVNIAVEEKLQKQLPITVRTSSEVADGYAIRNKTASPNLITVEGAESVVNTIEEVVVDVDVNGASESLSAYAAPVFLDKNGNEIDSSKFDYDVKEESEDFLNKYTVAAYKRGYLRRYSLDLSYVPSKQDTEVNNQYVQRFLEDCRRNILQPISNEFSEQIIEEINLVTGFYDKNLRLIQQENPASRKTFQLKVTTKSHVSHTDETIFEALEQEIKNGNFNE